jgi:short-subunit dehydrogenase
MRIEMALRTELHGEHVHVALVLPGVVDTPMAATVDLDPEFMELWPPALNMPPSWVVWAIFAAARFQLVEISVPPGTGTLEKVVALAPGVADSLVHWLRQTAHWLAATS